MPPSESTEASTKNSQDDPSHNAFSGTIWMFFTTGIGKIATLLTQIVLGWVLSKQDFGLYALALSVATSVSLLRNGGTQQILIQRGERYSDLAPLIVKFAFYFNCTAFLILLILAPVAAQIYDAPELTWMIGFIALSFLLMTPSLIFRAKLSIAKRFKSFALIKLSSDLVRQFSTMFFALIGIGPLSFVLPMAIEPVLWGVLGWICVKQWPNSLKLTWKKFKEIFKDARWVMLGTLAISVTQNGDYFIIGLFESKTDLGIYFFSLQLTVAVSVLFVSTIETVMLPILAPLKMNLPQLKDTFKLVLRNINFIGIPLTVGLFFSIEPLVGLFWQGKWEDAVPIAQILSLTVPANLLVSLGRTLTEALGYWRYRLWLIGGYGLGGMITVAIAAWLGDLLTIATFVCLYRGTFALTQCILVGRLVDLNIFRVLHAITLPLVVSIIAAYCTFGFVNWAMIDVQGLAKLALLLCVFFVTYLLLSGIFMKQQLKDIIYFAQARSAK